MRNKRIKYIGFYDYETYAHQHRISFLAATTKMDYIAKALVEAGNLVEIVSPSWTKNEKGYYPKRRSTVADGIILHCGPTIGAKNRFSRYLRILLSWIWLLSFLVKNAAKSETIIVYHSMMIMYPIMLAQRIKKFELILEVEEIYQDVASFTKKMERDEYQFFLYADKYLFPTELLNEKLNNNKKPHCVIHGTYQVEEIRNCSFNDGKIHLVYAGTFDPRKGGADAAAAAAFLPKDYHVHIIGFGNEEETKFIQEQISEISKTSECTITYDGLLKGEEYVSFLQKCHIGLSTQNPNAIYNETSFPSKILSYMANGLRVVSIRIRAIEISAVSDAIYYYEEQNPQSIAEAIMSIDLSSPYDSREIIRRLDDDFVKNLKTLLEN